MEISLQVHVWNLCTEIKEAAESITLTGEHACSSDNQCNRATAENLPNSENVENVTACNAMNPVCMSG